MAYAKVKSEISATLMFRVDKADYGVERSPVWSEIDLSSVEIENVWMFGKDWSEKEMRLTFGDMAVEAIIGYLADDIEDIEDDE